MAETDNMPCREVKVHLKFAWDLVILKKLIMAETNNMPCRDVMYGVNLKKKIG